MRNQRHLLLLATLLGMFVAAPFVVPLESGLFVMNLLGAIVVGTSTYTLSGRRAVFITAMALSAFSIGATGWLLAFPTHPAIIISHISYIAVVGFCAFAIFGYVFHRGRVTADRISAAICVYLLMAFTWSYGYALLDELQPGSFSGLKPAAESSHISRVLDLRYFSVITLTTVGYGDILAISPIARTMAALEALFGQIYMTVLVAFLVGMYVAYGRPVKPE